MINFNKKDSVAAAVDSILKNEEIDVNDRTKDTLTGRKKTDKKDDVGPGSDFKSSKVRFHAGPDNVDDSEQNTPTDATKEMQNKTKLGMKEETQSVDEALKGNQHKIDANKNKKIDAQDFKILRSKKSLKSFKKENEEHSMIDQMINEVLSKDASAGAWIHDFVHSDNPKFAGKSKEQRKKQALAAYYAKQRNEEVEAVEEGLGDKVKTGVKKFLAKVGGGSDEDQLKRLQKNMGVPQTGKKPEVKEDVEQLDELSPELQHSYFKKAYDQKNDKTVPKATRQKRWKGMNKVINRTLKRNTLSTPGASQDFKDQEARRGIGHVRDHVENDSQVMGEGWDDMVKDAKEKFKSGPKPSGGSGVKQGSRYGGSKQKDEKEPVKEGKQPYDNVPFDPPYNTTSSPDVKDKSGAVHTPMSRVKHIARQAMKKVKKNLGEK